MRQKCSQPGPAPAMLPGIKIHLHPHLQGSLQLQNNSLWQTGTFDVFFLLLECANPALRMITSAPAMLCEVLLAPSVILVVPKGLETPIPLSQNLLTSRRWGLGRTSGTSVYNN